MTELSTVGKWTWSCLCFLLCLVVVDDGQTQKVVQEAWSGENEDATGCVA